MKNKISIYLNMIIICLSLCVISIGVYSLTSANLTISGSLGYVYHEKTITATAQYFSSTSGGDSQATATELTISKAKYIDEYSSNITTISLSNDIYFSGVGWDAPNIEILITAKNVENTDKAVVLLFDDIEGLGYTRKVAKGEVTDPASITENHSSAVILSKGDQATFRLTLKQSIRKTNLVVSKDKLNIQLSVADYDTTSFDDTTTIDGITYSLNADQKSWSATGGDELGDDVTFCTIIQGMPVNIINAYLYSNIGGDRIKLTIPNSVTDIEICTTNVWGNFYLPGSLINIDGSAFYNESGGMKELISTNYIYNFETIEDYAFNISCVCVELELQSNELKSIGQYAFCGWYRLTTITIPSGVTTIGDCAFTSEPYSGSEGCYHLIEVVNKSNLDIQAGSTDNGCIAQYAKNVITDISETKLIKNDVDGYYVYNESDESKILVLFTEEQNEFSVPNDITEIYNYAFYDCDVLTKVTIPASVTSIGDYAFKYCRNLATVTLNNGLETIGEEAFYSCTTLTSITIPTSVTSIGTSAFAYCSKLATVILNNGLKTIGDSAFISCIALTSITIPTSVTSIGDYVFKGCSSLTSISVDSNNTIYDSRDNCNAIIETSSNTLISGCKNTTIPTSVTSIGGNAFYSNDGLESITIPSSVTSIGDDAFYYCRKLETVTLNTGLKTIGDYAFRNCEALTSITIPSSVTSIGNSAFDDCNKLETVTLNTGLKTIGRYAFYYCKALTSITIPSSVTSIGRDAFYYCSTLATVTFEGATPPTTIGSYIFDSCSNDLVIYVPSSAVETYKSKLSSYSDKIQALQ